MKHFLKYLLLISLFSLFLSISLIVWIIGTESGLQFLVTQAKHYAPGELTITQVQGRLIDSFSVTGLSYRYQKTSVNLNSFKFAWQARDLLKKTLHIALLHVDNLKIHLPKTTATTTDTSNTPIELPTIQLPILVKLDSVHIKQVTLTTADAPPVVIDSIMLNSTATAVVLTQQLTVKSSLLNATLEGTIGLQAPHAIHADIEWSAPLPTNLQAKGTGKITGDTKVLTLTHDLQQPASVQLQATVNDVLGQLNWTAKLQWQQLQWPLPATACSPSAKCSPPLVNSRQGHLTASGTLQNYQIAIDTELLETPTLPAGQWTVTTQGDFQHAQIKTLRAETLSGIIKASGAVRWQPALTASANMTIEHLSPQRFWADWPQALYLDSQLTAKFTDKALQVESLQVSVPTTAMKLALQGKVLFEKGLQFQDTSLTWAGLQWPLAGNNSQVTSAKGKLTANGTLENYRAKLEAEIAGAQIPRGQWSIAGQGSLQQFTVATLRTETLQGVITGFGKVNWQPTLNAELHLDAAKIKLSEVWPNAPTPMNLNSQLVAIFDSKLTGSEVEIKQFSVQVPETSTQVSLTGQATLVKEPRFQATLAWQNAQWPLLAKQSPLVSSRQGNLHVAGTLAAYQLQLTTEIAGREIPAGHWQLVGQGDKNSLQLANLQSKILQGTLNLQGKVNWQPTLTWQATVTGDSLNLGSQWAQIPSYLGLDVHTQGSFKNGQLDTQIDIRQLQGMLVGYPIALKTQVGIQGSRYRIQNLSLASGKNQLTAKGVIDKHSQLEWTLNAPELETLVPPLTKGGLGEVHGSLNSQGNLTGLLTLPHIVTTVNGKSLAFQNNHLGELQAKIDVNLQSGDNLQVNIEANDYQQGTTRIKQLRLQGQGSMNAHTLMVSVQTPENKQSVSLQAHGGYDLPQTRWHGALDKLGIALGEFGTWQLRASVPLTVSPSHVELAELCLQNAQKVSLCAAGQWRAPTEATLQMRLEELSLQLLRPLLPSDMEIDGRVASQLTASLLADGSLRANALVTVSPGHVKSRLTEEMGTLPYSGGKLEVHITENGLAADLDFKLLDHSAMQGSLTLPHLNRIPLAAEQPLQGQLQATFADAQMFPVFVPALANTRGTLRADVTLGGTLGSPKINGQVQLQQAATDLPNVGLALKEIYVRIRGDNSNTVQLQAQLKSGKGILHITGQMRLTPSATEAWLADIQVTGDHLEVVNIPAAWALASPRITVHIVPQRVEVQGNITIPEATITPTNSSAGGLITVSDDVVIVNPQKPTSTETVTEQWAISSRVKIILGDKVTFNGMGFNSHIGGAIIASNLPHKETTGNGELHLLAGTYKAYGQNLKVERGRITFAGGPIDNPSLDVRASRRIRRTGEDDVIAGIQVLGTAQAPKISLFSVPTLDQTNTLSYILLGKPASSATSGENQVLLSAASTLPFAQGEGMIKKISTQLGLDEAGLSSEGGIGETALVVGKYLSPNLYISYGIGLFDSSNVFRIRYELSKRWRIETETGTQSGVDLRYTLER